MSRVQNAKDKVASDSSNLGAKESFLLKTGALDQVKDIILAVDNQNTLIYINRAAERQYNVSKEQALGKKLNELYRQLWFNPDDEHRAYLSLKEKGYWEGASIHLQPDGSKEVMESIVTPIKDDSGKQVGLLSITRDITSRVNVDQWLIESNQRLKYVIEAAGMMVYEINVRTNQIIVIRGLEELLGYSVGEVPATIDWWISQIHPNDAHRAKEQFYPTKSTEKVVNEYRIHRKDGGYIIVRGTASIITNLKGDPERIIGSMQDVTKERSLEKELQDKERMSTIGVTAGMVGHDIRNPLQAITSDIYLIKSDIDSAPKCIEKENIKESLSGIEKNVEYINKIVQDLQDYAKTITPSAQKVDLSGLCEEVLFKNGIPKNIQAVCKVGSEASKITSDSALLKRILSNLTSNAVQAMPEGGKLTLAAYKNEGDVVITVEDTGVGIAKEVKEKLFTPMFTTKARGQGFGLAVVKRMTEALGGSVTYESEVGKGTKFIIRLPPPQRVER